MDTPPNLFVGTPAGHVVGVMGLIIYSVNWITQISPWLGAIAALAATVVYVMTAYDWVERRIKRSKSTRED